MSLYGISDVQLQQMMYPHGPGTYSYGNVPIYVNKGAAAGGVQTGGVSGIGNTPVETGVTASTGDGVNASLGVAAGQTAATGVPGGAAATPAVAGGGYASIAGAAIGQIAQVASDYVKAKGASDALAAQQAIPAAPKWSGESAGALAGFQAPKLPAL